MRPLRIALVASEVAPFAKTGGLADVAAGLARYLGGAGHEVRVFMPLYQRIEGDGLEDVEDVGSVRVKFNGGEPEFRLRGTTLPASEVPVLFVDCPEMFSRDNLYSSTYADEHVRFGLLCRAALESCQRMQWGPDVFQLNDWHTALLPLYLKTLYAWDGLIANAKTVLTIHNIGYQGHFGPQAVDELGLGEQREFFHQDDLAAGSVNFLKTGVMYADAVTTVSRTYAREIQTEEFGMGLDGMLRQRSDALLGIVNGVDYGDWNPAIDPLIPATFTAADLSGKTKCRAALLDRFNLAPDPKGPVFGIVSRLTGQKGFELLPDVLPVLLRGEDVRLCVLGSGEERHEDYFQWLRNTFPEQVGVYLGYSDELAHWIEAGSDAFLMPSRFEPCGLNQMYSLKYGTAPIVRRTGGLADTVEPFDLETWEGNGFVFDSYDSEALFEQIRKLLVVWRDLEAWDRLVQNAMAVDWSWDQQGAEYVELYRYLIGPTD